MTLLVDANVLIAALAEEDGDGPATRLLNADRELCTAVISLMEVRSVLTKKKRIELSAVEDTIDGIASRIDVYALERDDVLRAYTAQQDTLLYPVDCMLLSLADDIGASLVTFDTELTDAGAVTPAEALT